MGIRSRVLILALSQLIATLPAFGSVIFGPLWAMITLAISYFFVFLFVMNNVGGNLPILVDPLSKAIGYREAIMIFYAGFYALSSILFFLTMFLMDGPVEKEEAKTNGMDNKAFENEIPMRNAGRSLPSAPHDSSRL
ncbi:Cis, cis-muconate transporter protein [Operophtera brumata]|uniref:Cis, cis-muconate transporter protein n=1 Tax=Operophtera brumata TaxID=104452 RepID=A0A0L7LCJ8_OPEBR|nr:Cis, cis-muconate transporter protein [Operophtera brumata]